MDTLVLPGGGIRGFYLLGALQACVDFRMCDEIKNYICTSIGAIIGYLLAIGYDPIEIFTVVHQNKWIEKIQFFNLVAMINGNGATSFAIIHEALEKMTIGKIGRLLTMKSLQVEFGKTLICTTFNMTKCETEYISPNSHPELPCLTALRMTANIPLVFERFKYMNNYYIDGGMFDNFPLVKGQEIGNKILGFNFAFDQTIMKDNPEDGMMLYIYRLIQLPIVHALNEKNKQVGPNCTIITLETGSVLASIDFSIKIIPRLEMFSSGYKQALKSLDKCIDV